MVTAGAEVFTIADVPGLIPGASQGKGLGLEFLRHIERCSVLVHVVDCATYETGRDPCRTSQALENELAEYTPSLSSDLADRPRLVVLNKIDVPEARELAEFVTPGPARPPATGSSRSRRPPTRACASCGSRSPRSSRADRAARPAPAAQRIVLRPQAVDADAVHRRARSGGRRRLHRPRASARSGGSGRPTSPTTRRSATWPTGWPGSASRSSWPQLGAAAGAPVTIGDVTFDWEPTTLAGVDVVPTGRGTDLRLDQTERVGAAERKALHRLRRGLDVDGHDLDDDRLDDCRRHRARPGRRGRRSGGPMTDGRRRPCGASRCARRRPQRARRSARRRVVVVKVGSSSLTTAAGGLDPPRLDALVDAVAGAGGRRLPGRAGVVRCDRRRAGAARPAAPPAGPGDPAGRGLRRPAAARRAVRRARSPGTGSRVGQVLLTSDDVVRRAHYRNAQRTFAQAAVVRRRPGRERERHRRHRRDPFRRQRSAGRAGRAPGRRRRAGPAVRRRRAVHRRPAATRLAAGARGARRRRPGRHRDRRAEQRGRHRRHGVQADLRADRDRGRHPGAAGLGRRRRCGAGACRRTSSRDPPVGRRSAPPSPRPPGGPAPGCSGCGTPRPRRVSCCSTHGAVAAVAAPPEVAAAGRDHRASTAISSPATSSTCSSPEGASWPAASSATTPPSCRRMIGRTLSELPPESAASGRARRRPGRGASGTGASTATDRRGPERSNPTKEPEHVGDRSTGRLQRRRDRRGRQSPSRVVRVARRTCSPPHAGPGWRPPNLAQLTARDEGRGAAGDGRRAARPASRRDPGRERRVTSRPPWQPAPPTRWWTGCGSTTLASTAMAAGLRELVGLPDPVGTVVRGSVLPNGLQLRQVRVPLGVVAIIYEARPNVTVDAAGIALKAGNAALLRGSASAFESNQVLVGRAVRRRGRPPGCRRTRCTLVPGTDRESVKHLMTARGLVDVIIPRGGAGPDPGRGQRIDRAGDRDRRRQLPRLRRRVRRSAPWRWRSW